MQMTEPFATTVAAVAPVVWLVGAVEAHQVTRRLAEVKRRHEEVLAAAVAELEGADDAAILARPWNHKASVLSYKQAILYVFWLGLACSLVLATLFALQWLGGSGRDPQPLVAEFCYWAVSSGMMFVTTVPILMALARLGRSNRLAARLYKSLKDQRSEAESRVSTSP